MKFRLTPDQMARACYLWEQKGWNTLQIAEHLKLGDPKKDKFCESVVYRSLAERRDERARMRQFAKRMAG